MTASTKEQTQDEVLEFVTKKGKATVDEVVAEVGISRTSARKYLVSLEADKKLTRTPGGRQGRRKLPDRFSPVKGRRSAPNGKKGSGGRLRPGELDGLVLAYLRQHQADGPLTASKVGKGIGRSSGAVANCLERLAGGEQVRRATKRPRAYTIAEEKSR
jgi:hypothetical protein